MVYSQMEEQPHFFHRLRAGADGHPANRGAGLPGCQLWRVAATLGQKLD